MSSAGLARPLLVFGLRGTLLERLHASKVPATVPSSVPLITVGLHKVWTRPHLFETLAVLSQHCDVAVWSSTTAKNTTPLMEAVFSNMPQPFRFVWTREHTSSDDFRRMMNSQHEDEHATLKDIHQVLKQFPEYKIERTVLIDDTPSKARQHSDNFIWLQSFGVDTLTSDAALPQLQEFILKEILPAEDVRRVLPRRV